MYKKEAVLSFLNKNQKRLTGSRVWFSGDWGGRGRVGGAAKAELSNAIGQSVS